MNGVKSRTWIKTRSPITDVIVFHLVGLFSLNPKFLISHLGWSCICRDICIVCVTMHWSESQIRPGHDSVWPSSWRQTLWRVTCHAPGLRGRFMKRLTDNGQFVCAAHDPDTECHNVTLSSSLGGILTPIRRYLKTTPMSYWVSVSCNFWMYDV